MSDKELIEKYVDKENQQEALNKLTEGIPVQYIIGNVEFLDNIIDVNNNVLIPRFETELLVSKTIDYMNKYGLHNSKILDIGTGSGCISIALKTKFNNCCIDAIDISNYALKVAKSNAIKNNVDINFINEGIENYNSINKYNVIISNPPYIDYSEEVDPKTKYEPQIALFAIDNGLYFYKKIIDKIEYLCTEKYLICFEIGITQGEEIKKYALSKLKKSTAFIEKDYTTRDRFIFITNYE